MGAGVEWQVDVAPSGQYRLPGAGRDGVLRRLDGVLTRAIHYGDECAVVRAWPTAGGVRIRARSPKSRLACIYAVERMRFGLAVDHDLHPFQRRFRLDPLIGPVIRRRPWLRPRRQAEPFEALAWAITEQLIESDRALAIQRRLVWRYGRVSSCGRLRDSPSAGALALLAPAELQACDLSAIRSLALIRAARNEAAGRLDWDDHDRTWQRLQRIRGIGPWTCEKLAVHGLGRDDRLPAGDLAYLKLVGGLLRLGRRATVEEVHDFFAPYEPFQALAGLYALAAGSALDSPMRRPTAARARAAARW